jgi:hypothetical protein
MGAPVIKTSRRGWAATFKVAEPAWQLLTCRSNRSMCFLYCLQMEMASKDCGP